MKRFLAWNFIALALVLVESQAIAGRSVVDKGYLFDDGGRKIKYSEPDGNFSTVTDYKNPAEYNPNIPTACRGKNLPPDQVRNYSKKEYLTCSGQLQIHQKRTSEPFESKARFKELLHAGDRWGLYNYMRAESKGTFEYKLPYTTHVRWTWTKKQRGANGKECGYRYKQTSCQEKIKVTTTTCRWVPDPPSDGGGGSGFGGSSGGGGGGWGGSSGGGGGGGGGYQDSDPFGYFDIKDLFVSTAYAGQECDTDVSYDYNNFPCYERYPETCTWDEPGTQGSMTCSHESMPVTLTYNKYPESQWNPDKHDYVPFLPNGYDLLPGEVELARMKVEINGSHITHDQPTITGGEQGDHPSYYKYQNHVNSSPFSCQQGAKNELTWEVTTLGRQVSKTPNSLNLPLQSDRAGIFSSKESIKLETSENGFFNMPVIPEQLRLIDSSAGRLNMITSALRSGTPGAENSWKDTFFRIQLYEVFPGRKKTPIRVTETVVETDSLINRTKDIIMIPLSGHITETKSVYHQAGSSNLVKGYFKVTGAEYKFIPEQPYELRLSMLHRGIPFYESGCADNQVSCEREEPNLKAFSDEYAIRFIFNGPDERGVIKRWHDYIRRKTPW